MPSLPRPPSLRLTLAVKVGLLLAAIGLLAFLTLWRLHSIQRRSVASLLKSERHERTETLVTAIELTAEPLRRFSSDYSQWDDMVRFIRRKNPKWAAVNIDAPVDSFGLSAAWVLRPDGTLVHASAGVGKKAPPLPLPEAALQSMLTRPPTDSFFRQQADRVVELRLASVHPSDDEQRTTPAQGWLLAAKVWDKAHLQLIGKVVHCHRVFLAPPEQPLPHLSKDEFCLRRALPGPHGETVVNLIGVVRSEELAIMGPLRDKTLLAVATSTVVGLAVGMVVLYLWIVNPLRLINKSLLLERPQLINTLEQRSDEMGRLARLVSLAAEQRIELKQNLEERARLARNLHDGTIQTAYAVGMSLAGARSVLRTKPEEAERTIDEVREALNATIRDLRAFITNLDPPHDGNPSLTEGARAVLSLMQGVRPFRFTLEIDENVAEALPGPVRLHLLHIVRESVSNSVRHGEAQHLTIRLRRDGSQALLELSDDGRGLTTPRENAKGLGLSSLTERTRELGGNLKLESVPGEGLSLRIAFPCSPGNTA